MVKISVILPVFNAEKFVERCIDSVLSQSHDNLELIIINDGSTDNSGKIIEKLALNDNRIVYKKINNVGVAQARNIGLSMVNGDYISFIDADDYYDNHMLGKLIEKAEKYTCDIVSCGYERIHPKKNSYEKTVLSEGYYNKSKLEKNLYKELFSNKKLEDRLPKSLWTKLIKKDLIKKNNIEFFQDLPLGEDKLFIATCFLFASSFYYLPEDKLYKYFYNESSVTNSYTPNLWENLKKEAKYIGMIDNLFPDYNIINQQPYVVIRNTMKAISNVGRSKKRTTKQKREEIDKIVTDVEVEEAINKIRTNNFDLKRKFLFFLIKYRKINLICLLTELNSRKI